MRSSATPPAALLVTLQEHRHAREAWAVATVLVVEVLGDAGDTPAGVFAGVEVDAVGDRLGLAAPGERLELRGRWERSKWGVQLKVADQVSRGIQEAGDAARWLERLDGVGPKLARALHQHFGDRLPAILAGTEEADLTDVHGIGEETAAHIVASYAELAISGDLESLRYLDEIKATRWEASKIVQWCAKRRRRPVEVLQGAPFDIMGVKGLGFKKVDRLARAAGCAATAPARIEAATVHQLDEITKRGSTMARLSGGRGGGLVAEVLDLLGLGERQLVRDAVQRLATGGRVIVAKGDDGKTWVHPAPLLKAERLIHRAATGKPLGGPKPTKNILSPAGLSRGSPGALPNQAAVECRPPAVGGDGGATANGSECQGGELLADNGAIPTSGELPPSVGSVVPPAAAAARSDLTRTDLPRLAVCRPPTQAEREAFIRDEPAFVAPMAVDSPPAGSELELRTWLDERAAALREGREPPAPPRHYPEPEPKRRQREPFSWQREANRMGHPEAAAVDKPTPPDPYEQVVAGLVADDPYAGDPASWE